MTRVLITGSRDWPRDQAGDVTDVLAELCREHVDLVVIHGACGTGVDAIASVWCRAHRVPEVQYPADWARHGRKAGPIRNAEMVATEPDLCVAWIHNNSRGASGCAELAERAGIPTTRYRTRSEVRVR